MKRSSRLLWLSCILFSSPAFSAQFYLSPNGNDTHNGTRQTPWKSFERAQQAIREVRRTQPNEPITLFLAGGRYEIEKSWVLNTATCGNFTAPLTITALPGEKPRLSGSKTLQKWTKVADPTLLDKLPTTAHGHVYQCDLRAEGITNVGDPGTPGKRPELFCNGEQQQLSRWPNEGFVYAVKATGSTPAPANWAGFKGTIEGVFTYADAHQNRWAQESDGWLNGYWFWDWKDDYQKIASIDTLHQQITLVGPNHHYGYKDSCRYRAINLFCELDAPGEWYLDRQTQKLYWYPAQESLLTQNVSLSYFDAPYFVEMQNCKEVTLHGLTFEESRGSGISITGGEKCTIEECELRGIGYNGIKVDGGSNHHVERCHLQQLGFSGIDLMGGDRKTLTPAGHRIENCVVEDFSLFQRTYQPAVQVVGCGLYIGHNRFEHSSSSAIRYSGNDILVEYNIIRDVVNESDDQGGMESYFNPTFRGIVIRYNLWEQIEGGTFSGAAGVRTDDMICGVEVYGNIFVRCGSYTFGGVQINGGKDNRIENNLFVRCPAAVSLTSMWTEEKWAAHLDTVKTVQTKLYEEVNINSEIYRTRYPELQQLHQNFNRNIVSNNLLIDCPKVLMTGHDGNEANNARQVLQNNTQLYQTGKTLKELCNKSFLKRYGLRPIPFEAMGPQKTERKN